jgi:hypothetical protein
MAPALRGRAVLLGLFLVVNVLAFSWCFRRFLLCYRQWGLLLVVPVMVLPAIAMAGVAMPFVPPLPGAVLALRGPGLLHCLLLRCRFRLLSGILLLRIFFCHNCQTD